MGITYLYLNILLSLDLISGFLLINVFGVTSPIFPAVSRSSIFSLILLFLGFTAKYHWVPSHCNGLPGSSGCLSDITLTNSNIPPLLFKLTSLTSEIASSLLLDNFICLIPPSGTSVLTKYTLTISSPSGSVPLIGTGLTDSPDVNEWLESKSITLLVIELIPIALLPTLYLFSPLILNKSLFGLSAGVFENIISDVNIEVIPTDGSVRETLSVSCFDEPNL